jgi:hypothetical protein
MHRWVDSRSGTVDVELWAGKSRDLQVETLDSSHFTSLSHSLPDGVTSPCFMGSRAGLMRTCANWDMQVFVTVTGAERCFSTVTEGSGPGQGPWQSEKPPPELSSDQL